MKGRMSFLWPWVCPGLVAAGLVLAVSCTPRDWNRLTRPDPAVAEDQKWMAGTDRPPTARTLHAMAKLSIAQGRDDEAEPILQKTISADATYLPAYVDLAEIRVRRRQFDLAASTLEAGLKVAPNDSVLLNDLGMCRVLQGQYAPALESFTRAASATPGNPRYMGNMAMALGMLGRYEESLSLYLQILPESDAHENLAVLCQARNDPVRAARERAAAAAQSRPATRPR